jgi:dTMP kinase
MLIAIEGIDGSGKGTQANILAERLRKDGNVVTLLRYPQYEDSFFGREVGRYLNGDFGTLDQVHPKFSALLYALDRFESVQSIRKALSEKQIVICDRYIGSNIAHQSARVPESERSSMASWIKEVEECVLEIPKPDQVIFLDMDVKQSQLLVAKKDKRSYTEETHDLHEASSDHLLLALNNFRLLAIEQNWYRINCLDSSNKLRTQADISEEIMKEVIRLGKL